MIMFGCLFGLLGAVFAFNRHPRLFEAVLRRIAALPAAMHFGDLNFTDLAVAKGTGQETAAEVSGALGSPFSEHKRQVSAPESAFR